MPKQQTNASLRARAHTHTHTLTLSLSLSHTHTLTHTHTHTHPLTYTQAPQGSGTEEKRLEKGKALKEDLTELIQKRGQAVGSLDGQRLIVEGSLSMPDLLTTASPQKSLEENLS